MLRHLPLQGARAYSWLHQLKVEKIAS